MPKRSNTRAMELALAATDKGGLALVLLVAPGSVHAAVDRRYLADRLERLADNLRVGHREGLLPRDRNGNAVEGGWFLAGRLPEDEEDDHGIEPDE